MASKYRRGFKKQAEDLALSVRSEMGLAWGDRLDPRALAKHIRIPVYDLEVLIDAGMPRSSVTHLLGPGKHEFSAALFERGGRRLIVANSAHSTARQASNIVHEAAHLLLNHEPPGEVLEAGCRRWNAAMELEADWMAGELLIPRRAALHLARSGVDVSVAAEKFGVSMAMARWRLNNSGALKQAERERAARQRR